MRQQSLQLIKEVLDNWRADKHFTYQTKEVAYANSPIVKGEFILRFKNSLYGIKCAGQEAPIFQISDLFTTTTLSQSPLSENVSADKIRLEKMLKNFDEQFDELIQQNLAESDDITFETDACFF